MDPDKQKQIMGYFIEEAKEHLDTLEKGLLNLQSTVTDPEKVNEMFRAAHSVKGGAAMLGFGSIQQVAHRFEDSFKILKENPVKVDQKLESLFLKSFDTLQDLLERLQGPFGLREEEGEQVVRKAEPVFEHLQDYLNTLLAQGGGTAPEPNQFVSKVGPDFAERAIALLREMLQLFRQNEDSSNRKQLVALCNQLAKLGADVESWQTLVKIARGAIANPQNNYHTLAPFVIKELKQAIDLQVVGAPNPIAPSPTLQLLAGSTASEPKQILLVAEPKAAAQTLIESFDKKQLTVLTKLLVKAVKSQS